MTSKAYEDDIPVAIATPQFMTDQQLAAPPTLLAKGRSSRVLIPDDSSSSSPLPLSDHEIHSLKAQGFTMGLINAMHRNNQIFPMRIWVVDNSGMWLL